MKLLRSIATLLLVLVAASTADDLAWYRSVLTEQVAPSYVAAYRTLKDKIINPLLPASSEVLDTNETNATQIVSLARRLTCATKALYGNLSSALKASEKLNQDLEKKLQELISSVSQKEKEVRQTNDQLSAIAARLADTQGKVNEAENTVRDKENELNQANSHLEDEQRKVDRARSCGVRKKRFIGSIFKPINNLIRPILRPICAVVNYGGINNAKDRRGAAQGAVNAAREQLAARRQELDRLRSEQANFQTQQSQTSGQLTSLSQTLAQLQARQVTLANMTVDIRKVVQHLASFVSKSSVLYDELQDLVSFDLLIGPLNGIMTELIDNGVTTQNIAGVTQISSVDIDSIQNTIALLKVQLPTLPLNEGASNTC